MKIVKVKDYEEMSQKAAELIVAEVKKNPQIVLGLATGSTPEGLYQRLIEDHQTNGTTYKEVTTFNLDEYIGLPKEDRNSYYTFMKTHLFDHIDVPVEQAHLPSGENEDLSAECEAYEALIHEAGGVDIQVLGIGGNGHIGFNEPGTSFDSLTHIIELDESTREANARFFNSLEEVPTQAITMGIQTIMAAKKIVLLASGSAKVEAISKLLSGEVTEAFPASCLHQHPNVTVIVDEAALNENK
ncbi:glucosamine-6-phosphate deaminase [Bacillus sp. REN10]|uniref:glucosamine-6-phosphate deaminase n=1 Tax=Bacillus sp. REN10 TaxID=2782541 RepID=UPI00193C3214|nr:glucosamine-6-phosphate deaminase [Bacillus sp. REN10]